MQNKKIFKLIALILFLFSGLFSPLTKIHGAATFVQSATAYAYGTNTIQLTLPGVMSGSVLALGAGWTGNFTMNSVTDDKGNAWVIMDNVSGGAQAYAKNAMSGNTIITITISGQPFIWEAIVHEITGVDTASPLDGHKGNAQTLPGTATDAVTSTSINTTVNGDYIFGVSFELNQPQQPNAGSGFVSRKLGELGRSEDKIQATVGSVAATFTATGNLNIFSSFIMAFKPSLSNNPIPDTTPPSTPANLSATAVSSSQINLFWNASTDNVGVIGYDIYRGGTLLASVTSTSYSNTGLSPSTAYAYTVRAKDAAGNTSSQSTSASATTQAPTPTPPTINSFSSSPSSLQSGQSSTLSWSVSNATSLSITPGNPSTSSGSVTVSPTVTTTYTLTATNATSQTAANTTITVSQPDTTTPSVPSGLSATAVSSSQINLSWSPSTDNLGVTGYKIYRNGSQITTTSNASYSDTGLSPSTAYSYTVSAYDAAGNNSGQSSSASATTGVAQQAGNLIDSTRKTDWSGVGAGTIPSRTTICATLNPGATPAQINSAIANCPSGQTVKLNAGTYNLSSGIIFNAKDNITLRGAGPDATFLRFTGSVPCGYSSSICVIGASTADSDSPPNVANWTGGYSQGATTITIGANTTGSTKPQVGWHLVLDQLDDGTTETGNVRICQTLGTCTQAGGGGGSQHGNGSKRPQMQIVTITSISAGACPCTVGISPGLYMPNWRSSQSPNAWWTNSAPASGDGIEDMSVDGGSNGALFNILFFNSTKSWAKNIRSVGNTGTGNFRHVRSFQSSHITLRDSYLFGRRDVDDYGFNCYQCSDSLVENNIFQRIGTPNVNENGQGNVFAYNYTINNYWGDGSWAQGSFYSHAPGDNYWLIEGNDGYGITLENYFGQALFITGFRNRLHGYQQGNNAQTVPIFNYAFSRYNNYIGNVLGTSGYHTNYEAVVGAFPGYNTCIHSIWALGLGQNCDTATADNPFTATTIMRWGNWDTATNGSRFVASEVPSNLPIYANAVPSSQALPPSLYLSSRPSWWGTMPWPAIGPDISGGDIAGVAGHAYRIPARKCFEDIMSGTFNDITPRIFNASTCYPLAGSGPSVHTITASAASGGTISPSGSVSVANGGSQTFTITPSSGYSISSVLVDGTSVGSVSSYTFSNVTTNHTISATFTLNNIVGDFNRDGLVNSLDLSLLTSAWNTSNATYDLNSDGQVNSLDYVIMVQNWSV